MSERRLDTAAIEAQRLRPAVAKGWRLETAATQAPSPPPRATGERRRRRRLAVAVVFALLAAGCGRGTPTQVAERTATEASADAGATVTQAPVLGTEPTAQYPGPPTLTATVAGPPTPTQTRVVQRTWTPPPALWTATPSPAATGTISVTAVPPTATVVVTGTAVVTSTTTPAPTLAVIEPGNVMSLSVVAAAGPGLGAVETAGITATATVTVGAALTVTATETPAGLGVRIDQVVWAADGQQFAAAGGFGILIYATAGGQVADAPARVIDTPSWATSAAFTPDGTQLAVGGVDNLVWVHDLANGELRVVLAGKTGRVEAVQWVSAPLLARTSGAVLVSLNGDTVHLWDVAEQAHLGSLPSAQGALLAVSAGNTSAGDAPLVAVGAGTTVRVWDLLELLGAEDPASVPPWRVLEQPAQVTSLALSADGRRLAVGNTGGTIVLWNVVTAQPTLTLARLNAPAERLAFSPDGLLLASAHTDHQVRLWAAPIGGLRLNNGALLRALEGHADRITSLAFAPDGRALLTAGWEGVVRVWGVR